MVVFFYVCTMKIQDIEAKVFLALGKEDKFVEYHNIIYKLVGVVVDFVNLDGKAMNILPFEHLNKYCAALQRSPNEPCQCYTSKFLIEARNLQQVLLYRCYAGLTDLILPLYDEEKKYIGALTAGQFFVEGETPCSEEFISDLGKREKVETGDKTLYELYMESPVLNQRQIEGLIDFLHYIGEMILDARSKILFWEQGNAADRIQLIRDYIHQNYMKDLSVEKIAARFFLSPNYFCRYFKKSTGVTFVEYLNLYRIQKAEELLRNRALGIMEISIRCGFGSISQFYRYFKQIKGVSPKELRKKTYVQK
jgi:AraC-like DNA-binding protein/ligand-binding sensor protein